MKPDLSEFSYGFALTSELIQSFKLQSIGAPVFPSLTDEGKPGGGFDVKLPGVPVFLQFKLSDYLKTARALDFAGFGGPYYRFKLRALKHSKQHELLRALELKGNLVLYCAPRFHTSSELNKAFVSLTMCASSVFVKPSSIGILPSDKEHSVSFGSAGLKGILRSEPVQIRLSGPDVFQSIEVRPAQVRPSYRQLSDQLIDVYIRHTSDERAAAAARLREQSTDRPPGEHARFVALSLFDCELLFIAPAS